MWTGAGISSLLHLANLDFRHQVCESISKEQEDKVFELE